MKTIKFVVLSSAAILASACGPLQTSPYGANEDLRNGTVISAEEAAREAVKRETARQQAANPTPTPVPVDPRVRVSKGLIDLRTEGSLNFIENKTSEFLVKARVVQLDLKYELVFSGLPAGAKVSDVDAQTKKITWTPVGIVEAGKDSKSFKFEVELKQASKLSEAAQTVFDAETKKETFEILVSRTKENPVVQNVTGLDGVVSEGTIVKFVVQVRDPGAQGTLAPIVNIKADSASSRETIAVDGSAYITADSDKLPTSSAPGVWNFSFIYDTASKAAPRPAKLGSGNKHLAADEIPVRFKIEIESPSQRKTSTSKEFRLRYNTQGQTPQFTILSSTSTVEIGQRSAIDVKVTSAVAGKIVVDWKAAQELLNTNFPNGTKTTMFRCKNNGTSEVECRLGINLPCDESLVGSSHKLAVTATNSVGAIAVAGSLDQTITITKTNETNCTAANPTAGGDQ